MQKPKKKLKSIKQKKFEKRIYCRLSEINQIEQKRKKKQLKLKISYENVCE